MKVISEEALRRFKQTDPNAILDYAEERFRQLSEEEQQKLREFIADYPDPDDLYSRLESQGAMINRILKLHQEYLSSHQDTEFSAQEIAHHNEFIDDLMLNFVYLGDRLENFPSLPVLPPPAPLIKVSGIIEEVEFTKAMACFDAEVYSTVRDELERKRQRDNIGALVAMTAQVLSGAPPHAMIQDGRLKKQKCLYVKGKIDGKVFSGWFGMTNIRPGDRVEMAVMLEGDGYLAYAIANPEQRTISVTPRCFHGGGAISFFIFFFILIGITLPFLLILLFDDMSVALHASLWYLAVISSGAFWMYKLSQKSDKPITRLFEDICSTLDIPESKKLDLDKLTRKRFKNGGEPVISNRNMPKKTSGEYFYYY